MARRGKHLDKIGSLPGTLFHTGETDTPRPSQITQISYNTENFTQITPQLSEISLSSSNQTGWIICQGIHHPESVKTLGQIFELHEMSLEDVLHVTHLPKLENHGTYLFCIIKSISLKERIEIQQISLFLTKNYVLLFSEDKLPLVDAIIERIKTNQGKIRQRGADFLFYSLLDIIVDQYYLALNPLQEQMEMLEDSLAQDISSDTLTSIHRFIKKINFLNNRFVPVKEISFALTKRDMEHIEETSSIYFKDLNDHISQICEELKGLKEKTYFISELYFNLINIKTNQIVKTLTVMTAIFLPLTFLAGIYGMNFRNMPELEYKWGYYILLIFMLILGIGSWLYIKKKKWL